MYAYFRVTSINCRLILSDENNLFSQTYPLSEFCENGGRWIPAALRWGADSGGSPQLSGHLPLLSNRRTAYLLVLLPKKNRACSRDQAIHCNVSAWFELPSPFICPQEGNITPTQMFLRDWNVDQSFTRVL